MRGTDGVERHVEIGDACGQPIGTDGVALTGVDDDAVSGEDEVVTVPVVEVKPVVRPDDETKQTVRPSAAKLVKGVDHIGWTWELVLEVADTEPLMAFDGETGETETKLVVEETAVALERILRRDHEPELVHEPAGDHCVSDGRVAEMDGVEGAAEDTGAYHG